MPTTDIYAVGDDLVVRRELAGVGPDDVEISLSGGALTIDGERTGEPDASEYHARERYYGRSRRRLKPPDGIDGSRINAKFENGLLEIAVRGGADRQEPEIIRIEHTPSGATSIRAG